MNHWIMAPVILPALLGPILAYVMRYDITLARWASMAGTVALAAIALGLAVMASDGATHVYYLGNWPAPFGIVLVLDQLSAVMVLLTALLALVVLWHVMATDWDMRGRHFHSLFQFQLMGVFGAFLTGDAFNLFVFFEVLLIASYGLMIFGGGKLRLKAGLQYVVMNLAGSTLFLFALGALYASTGTLNLADLAEKVRLMPIEDAALLRVAAVLLLMVFAIKAALFPVQFWLPGTYANAPAPVAALFAIMTKVGAYAILRFHTLVFGPDVAATEGVTEYWLVPGAVITVAVGALGVLAAKRMMPMLAFAVVGSMGTLMLAVAAFTPEAAATAIYYLVHSTFAAAALFLLADLVVSRRQDDQLTHQPPVVQHGLFSALFFVAAIAMTGMPPLSGFLGKLLVMDGVRDMAWMPVAWAAILIGSLITIVGFARAGSAMFWKATALVPDERTPGQMIPPTAQDGTPATVAQIVPVGMALALLALMAGFAGPLMAGFEAASNQLFDVGQYIEAVLRGGGEGLK